MKIQSLILAGLILCTACSAQVRQYRVRVVKEYPHDVRAYTQGLFFHDGVLYESTGGHGSSSLRTVDLESGKPLQVKKLQRKYFGEGSVILDGSLYLLTWQSQVAFRYDASTLEYKETFSWPREGWGLTTDGKQLIASDGSANLYFLDSTMKVKKHLHVTMNDRPVMYLNELEWIDGKIWANVYTTDYIVIIDPSTGKVEGRINCKGLLPDSLRTATTDVLNGIAIDGEGGIYLTGKNWPRLYKVNIY